MLQCVDSGILTLVCLHNTGIVTCVVEKPKFTDSLTEQIFREIFRKERTTLWVVVSSETNFNPSPEEKLVIRWLFWKPSFRLVFKHNTGIATCVVEKPKFTESFTEQIFREISRKERTTLKVLSKTLKCTKPIRLGGPNFNFSPVKN